MDFIVPLILVALVVVALVAAFRPVRSEGGSTAARSPRGRRTGVEMRRFEIRTVRRHIGDDDTGPEIVAVEGRGLIPVRRNTRLGFVTSVFDATSETPLPVLSTFQQFQEKDSVIYQHRQSAGTAGPNQGLPDWVGVGVVILDSLVPPEGGDRSLTVLLRIIDEGNPPEISMGLGDGKHPGMLLVLTAKIDFSYPEMGWQQEATGCDEARELALRIAVAVALADGPLDDSEGSVIRAWIEKTLSFYREPRAKEMKQRLNQALRSAYDQANAGELLLSVLTERMNEISPEPQKLEAIQLSVDVMAADAVMDDSELKIIHAVAESLKVDYDEMQKIVQLAIGSTLNLETRAEGSGAERILGIQPEWDTKIKLKHLRQEFGRWNSQMQVLPPGRQKENAQKMLHLIGELRSRYRETG